MLWKIQVKPNKLVEFLSENVVPDCNILKMYVEEDGSAEIFHQDYYGYGEPTCLFKKFKHLLDDIWWIDMTCSRSLIGRNMSERWNSCKKELTECGEDAFD